LKRKNEVESLFLASSEIIKKSIGLTPKIEESIQAIIKCIKNGNKVVIFGNGGSAADAQHIAAELVGRFRIDRKSYPALALTANSSTVTALSNDYSYDVIFSRQCESLVNSGDVVIGISTSGNSENVNNGLIISKKKGAVTIGLLGNKGGKIKKIVDIPIVIESSSTPRIQEAHRTIYHIICEIVEKNLADDNS
jgi:D-sedoheptulose 7-phosphate isomerase